MSQAELASQPRSGAVPRYLDELSEIGGLSFTDIANITDGSKATVSRWRAGSIRPQPATQLLLSDLRFIVGRLSDYYAADEIRPWLYARHPQLHGAPAIGMINQNKSEAVLPILDRLDAEVYL